jgi:serine/threonine-protein kinase
VQPKLLDFGIVKSAQADGSSDLSEAGSVVGSPDYMSPEQARGLAQVDSRSDLWSFSVVLYEAIAGVPPFQANDHDKLLRMIVEDEPKSLLSLGVANHALSYIVARGLSKDPLERYASLSQMGKALAAWLADQGITEDACGVSLEAKWLARATDPHGLRRASWPPPSRPTEKAPSSRSIALTFVDGPAAQATTNTLPPSSLTPVADSSVGDERPVRRSKLALVVGALLALPVAGLAFTSLRTEQPALAAASSRVPERVAGSTLLAAPPAAVASTAAPVAPIPSGSAETAVPRVTRQPKPSTARRRPAPVKPPPGAGPRPTAARPSDMLAPMPF